MSEPSSLGIFLTNVLAIAVLIGCYFFGVVSRTYILPPDTTIPWRKQMVAAIPAGLITMGMYAKSALPPLLQAGTDPAVVFDIVISLGYAILLGMLSRETLDKLLAAAAKGGFEPQPRAG